MNVTNIDGRKQERFKRLPRILQGIINTYSKEHRVLPLGPLVNSMLMLDKSNEADKRLFALVTVLCLEVYEYDEFTDEEFEEELAKLSKLYP